MGEAAASVLVCGICKSKPSIYTCPRCSLHYCCISCYKSTAHQQCSEQFYQECVNEELSTMENDPESKKAMESLLIKMRKELNGDDDDDGGPEEESSSGEDSDDYQDEDLSGRFDNLDLECSEDIWDRLTEREKSNFSQMLATAQIVNILPPWRPWWIDGDGVPEIMEDVPPFSSLTRCKPSAQMPALVMNTISAYQITARILRGEVHSMCVEAATVIWKLSGTLRADTQSCKSCRTRLDCNRLIKEEMSQRTWPRELDITYEQNEIAKDQEILCKQTSLISSALSEILLIFKEAFAILKKGDAQERCTGEPPSKNNVMKAEHKLRYYLSWVQTTDTGTWQDFIEPIKVIHD